MQFLRSDLKYSGYSWTVYRDDDSKVTGPPDSTLFNRKEGYEVLYLINKMAKDKSTGYKIEMMLHDHLPGSVRSQKNVAEWVKNNWEEY